jgi:TonB family protein
MRAARLATAVIVLSMVCMYLADASAKQSGAASVAQPAVVSAAAPQFPPIAKAANAYGDVIVEVEVDASGSVSATRAIEGHPLLRRPSAEAASRWRFAADAKAGLRKARLTFSFRKAETREDEILPVFEPPYKVVVVSITPCINYAVHHVAAGGSSL